MSQVQHDEAARRFSLTPDAGGPTGVLDYELAPGRAVFTHTVVPQALRGQGVATELVEAALHWARSQQLRVVPQCSYVQTYFQRHPEWQDLQA